MGKTSLVSDYCRVVCSFEHYFTNRNRILARPARSVKHPPVINTDRIRAGDHSCFFWFISDASQISARRDGTRQGYEGGKIALWLRKAGAP